MSLEWVVSDFPLIIGNQIFFLRKSVCYLSSTFKAKIFTWQAGWVLLPEIQYEKDRCSWGMQLGHQSLVIYCCHWTLPSSCHWTLPSSCHIQMKKRTLRLNICFHYINVVVAGRKYELLCIIYLPILSIYKRLKLYIS